MANSAFNPVAKATGGNLFHSDETVSGSVNGSNTVFTTQSPYVSTTLEVYVNGLRQARTTHVTETSPSLGTFTLDTAPLTGDIIRVNYQTTVAQTNAADTVDSFHASSTPTANKLIPLDSNSKFPSIVSNLPVINQQSNTTNSNLSEAKIETGWGYITLVSGTVAYTKGITFSSPFADRPIVLITCGGDNLTAAGMAYGNGDNSVVGDYLIKAYQITTNGFIMKLSSATAVGANGFTYFQWIAIGK